MKRSILHFVTLLLLVSSASAHDAKLHKGPMIHGKLISIQGDKAEVQTEEKKVTVLLTAQTKYELGKEGKSASKSDLKDGANIMVHGHKLDTGEFGATEVLIEAGGEHGTSDHADKHEGAAGAHSHDPK